MTIEKLEKINEAHLNIEVYENCLKNLEGHISLRLINAARDGGCYHPIGLELTEDQQKEVLEHIRALVAENYNKAREEFEAL